MTTSLAWLLSTDSWHLDCPPLVTNSACVSPSEVHGSETLNTLQYANRARNIQNKAEKNVESLDSGGSSPRNSSSPRNGKRLQRTASELEIHSLQEQICFLKQQLDQANAATAAATAVGTNIPSSVQVQIPPLHTKKNDDVRATERVTLMKESDADEDLLGVPLPVIPVTTKESKIKPPSRLKLTLPLSSKAAAQSSHPSSASVVTNGAPAAEDNVDVATIQNDCPDTPAAVADMVTAIEAICKSPSVTQSDGLAVSEAGVSSSVEPHASLQDETNSDSQVQATISEEALGVQEFDHADCTRTDQNDPEASPSACNPPPESTELDASRLDEMSTLQEVSSGNGHYFPEAETCVSDASPTKTESPKSTESVQVELTTIGRPQESETEVVPASDSDCTSSEECASDRNCNESVVHPLQELPDAGIKGQENIPEAAPNTAVGDQDSMTQQERVQEMSICDDKNLKGAQLERSTATECQNQAEVDEFAAQACSDFEIWTSDPLDVDGETRFSLVGPVPESESDDELGASACISPASSPVTKCTHISFVAGNELEISSYKSENWHLVGLAATVSSGEAGKQEPHDDLATLKKDSQSTKKSEPQNQDTEPVVDVAPEPDFVLHRPPPCQPLVSPRVHRRGRFSPQKLSLRPMNIFDFDDSWDKLQRSRPPSSVSRLESLVKVCVCCYTEHRNA